MDKIKKMFDDFVFEARVMPAVTIVFPLLIIALYNGILNNQWMEASVELVLAFVLVVYLANIARECGKSYEEKLFKKLNAIPTTIVMRFSDNRIDSISKIKYHKWFNSQNAKYQLPLTLEEEKMDAQSDDKYTNAAKDLRIYANAHRNEIPRVYQELKKYNYWRNLYGCKKLAIAIYIVLIVWESLLIDAFQLKEIIHSLIPKYGALFGIVIWTVLYCVVVTKKVVQRNAFDYAITLIETICDTGIRLE